MVGHSLTGLSIGVLCMPKRSGRIARAGHLLAFVVLASLPDLPVTGWGHYRYGRSHSLFVNFALIAVAVGLLAWRGGLRERIGRWPVVVCGAAAWLSHLLLDTFYNHGRGLQMFWPWSRASIALPMPWFSTLRGRWRADLFSLRVAAVEAAFYGAVLLLCILWRWRRQSAVGSP